MVFTRAAVEMRAQFKREVGDEAFRYIIANQLGLVEVRVRMKGSDVVIAALGVRTCLHKRNDVSVCDQVRDYLNRRRQKRGGADPIAVALRVWFHNSEVGLIADISFIK